MTRASDEVEPGSSSQATPGRRTRLWRAAPLGVALACLLGTVQLLAQPKAASTATKPAARAYQAKLEEWKDMLRKLQSLRASYVKASPNEAVSIRVEWNETIAMGDDLLSLHRLAHNLLLLRQSEILINPNH